MSSEKPWQAELPFNIPDQWPESRGFDRVYHKNPVAQERLVKALSGLHARYSEWGRTSGQSAVVAPAIRTVLRAFITDFPEFTLVDAVGDELDYKSYTPDEQLRAVIADIMASE